MSVEVTTPPIEVIHAPLTGKAAAVQALVNRFFGLLDGAGIPWCLLRNRDRIPFGMLTWSDIDVLVPAEASTSRLVDILSVLSPSQIVDVRPGLVTFSFPVEDLFIRVDICYGDLDWRGAPFVSASEILAGRWNDDGIMVASPLHQTYVTWISKLIWSEFFDNRYAPMIERALQENPTGLHRLLERAFGSSLASTLIELARDERLQETVALVPQLQRSLWRRSLRRQPRKQIGAYMSQIASRAKTLIHPSGLVVALISPDDVTTHEVCASLSQPTSRQMPCGRIDVLTDKQRVLPSLGRRRRNPATPVPAWIAVYDAVDRSLSHWKSTRYRLTRGRLVIDMRPHTPEIHVGDGSRLSRPLPHLLHRLAPRPDLIVVLETSAPRSDRPASEDWEARRAAYRTFAGNAPNAHLVNAEGPLERVVSDVKSLIIASYEQRTFRRYPRLST